MRRIGSVLLAAGLALQLASLPAAATPTSSPGGGVTLDAPVPVAGGFEGTATQPSGTPAGGPASETSFAQAAAMIYTTAGPGSAARIAIAYARAQLGLPYEWGGDGPANADAGFDCSGLTHAAYAAAAVTIPRTAQTQYEAGPHVPSPMSLQPGDLVFYGTPSRVHHVGLYIGGDQMINAPTFGLPVQIAPYRWLGDDFLGATRPAAADGQVGSANGSPAQARTQPAGQPSPAPGPDLSPAPSPSPDESPWPSASPSGSPSPAPSCPAPSGSPSPSPSGTPSPSPSGSPSPSPSGSPSPSPSGSPSPSPSGAPSPSPSPSCPP